MRKLLFLILLVVQACEMPETTEEKSSNLSPLQLAEFQFKNSLRNELEQNAISANSFRLFIRAFKEEQKLEAWVKAKDDSQFHLFKTYDFCKFSGELGPKRKEGDLQIPEGFYHINRFNPKSKFHLSLGLNYPNESDLILSDKTKPGSDIFLHGGCVTVGCIPITNEKIRELYMLASLAKETGQNQIAVHIFPFKMTKGRLEQFHSQNKHLNFWKSLQVVFQYFEDNKSLPSSIQINSNGFYSI